MYVVETLWYLVINWLERLNTVLHARQGLFMYIVVTLWYLVIDWLERLNTVLDVLDSIPISGKI